MVFIRPTILRSREEARAVTERRYGYIRARQQLQNPEQEPSIDELVREYMGAVPPVAAAPAVQPGEQVIAPPPGGAAAEPQP
jgi:general secretion pathway protein D